VTGEEIEIDIDIEIKALATNRRRIMRV